MSLLGLSTHKHVKCYPTMTKLVKAFDTWWIMGFSKKGLYYTYLSWAIIVTSIVTLIIPLLTKSYEQ